MKTPIDNSNSGISSMKRGWLCACVAATIFLVAAALGVFHILGQHGISGSAANSVLQPPVSPGAITSSDSPIARDSTHVWFNGQVVEGADPATFVLIPTQSASGKVYGRDRYHVYVKDTQSPALILMPGVDPKTFIAPQE